jgi:hypothetical protein
MHQDERNVVVDTLTVARRTPGFRKTRFEQHWFRDEIPTTKSSDVK